MSYRGNFCSRLQNSPYICVFKSSHQKVWNKTEKRERDCQCTHGGVRLATLTPRFTDFFTDFEKKTDCFAVYFCSWEKKARKKKKKKKKACTGYAAPQYRRGQGFQFWGMCTKSGYGVTIQMRATEQFFPVVLFITLYKSELFRLSFRICKCCF